MGFSINADLLLLHDFQECRLSLGGRTINFVGQEDVGEHGPLIETESLLFHIVNAVTRKVRRHQVRSKLDSSKLTRHCFRHDIDQQCFAKPRWPFDQDTPFSKQCDDNAFDQFNLTDHNFADLFDHVVEQSFYIT